MSPCPSREQLGQMLAGELAAAAEQGVTAHVETCAPCQRLLEELTAGSKDSLAAGPPARRPSTDRPRQKLSDDQLHRLRHLLPPGFSTPAAGHPSPRPAGKAGWPQVPGYEIRRELGRGGMGVVYEARHLRLNRPVALKMIRAGEQATPEELVRFCAEAEVVAGLRHPNIVQIYEVGTHNKQPYFALELMEGGNLAEAQAGKPWPAQAAAELVETLAHAMDYAHRQGIVHRDLNAAKRGGPQGLRLRPGQAPRPGLAPDEDRPRHGHPRLHGARAGARPARPHRAGDRRVRPGGDPVRVVDRTAALPGADGAGGHEPGDRPGAAAALPPGAPGAARPGGDLPEVPGKGTGAALRRRGGAGRRPPPLPGRRADPGPPGAHAGAGLALGQTAAGGGRPAGGAGRDPAGGPERLDDVRRPRRQPRRPGPAQGARGHGGRRRGQGRPGPGRPALRGAAAGPRPEAGRGREGRRSAALDARRPGGLPRPGLPAPGAHPPGQLGRPRAHPGSLARHAAPAGRLQPRRPAVRDRGQGGAGGGRGARRVAVLGPGGRPAPRRTAPDGRPRPALPDL